MRGDDDDSCLQSAKDLSLAIARAVTEWTGRTDDSVDRVLDDWTRLAVLGREYRLRDTGRSVTEAPPSCQ